MKLSEIIAAKQVAKEKALAAPTPGKSRGLVLSTRRPEPALPSLAFHDERSLGVSSGQGIDMTPVNPTVEESIWNQALNSFASELSITNDPADPTHAWISIFPHGLNTTPILVHRLQYREHPLTQRPANQPF
jgi:hypothetical protein